MTAAEQWAYSPRHPLARRRRLYRRARQSRWLGVAVLALVAALVVPFAVRASGGHSGAPVLVSVQPGDTLWEIAVRYTPPGADPRPLIYAIGQINHLPDGGLIQPGQTLIIPGQAP